MGEIVDPSRSCARCIRCKMDSWDEDGGEVSKVFHCDEMHSIVTCIEEDRLLTTTCGYFKDRNE